MVSMWGGRAPSTAGEEQGGQRERGAARGPAGVRYREAALFTDGVTEAQRGEGVDLRSRSM